MRFFQRLAQNEQVASLLNAVMREGELWNQDMSRTGADSSPYRELDDIILRSVVQNPRECGDRSEVAKFPFAKVMAFNLMRLVGGVQLGSLVICKLQPGQKIPLHVEAGPYADFYARYLVVLSAGPGAIYSSGDETVMMSSGDVWWLDHKSQHGSKNNSQDDFIWLLIDLRVEP